MARHGATHDDDGQNTNVAADIRTTDLSRYDDGEAIRVHYADDPAAPSKTVTGRVTARYADTKVMIETDDDRRLIVDFSGASTGGGLRDFDTNDTVGRPMFAETAFHPERDGEDVRDDLLDDDTDDGGSTLVFKRDSHGAHERTGHTFTDTETVRTPGMVDATDDDGRVAFAPAESSGVYYVADDGTVAYDPSNRDAYEVGYDGRVEDGTADTENTHDRTYNN